jgi:hypothetical protein
LTAAPSLVAAQKHHRLERSSRPFVRRLPDRTPDFRRPLPDNMQLLGRIHHSKRRPRTGI